MSATSEIRSFVEEHRPCGELIGNGSAASADGYRLFLQCACGLEFERWVPMTEATAEIAALASEN